MILKEITTEEWELIETIRNYRKSFPNGSRMMKAEIQELLAELMDLDYKEENEDSEDEKE